jgi:hypothetical protein
VYSREIGTAILDDDHRHLIDSFPSPSLEGPFRGRRFGWRD